jgi:hypothetical protein
MADNGGGGQPFPADQAEARMIGGDSARAGCDLFPFDREALPGERNDHCG